MTRTARFIIDEGYYHVVARGNNRARIFHDERDFNTYRQLLDQYCTDYQIQLYHYCLMPNHVHLMIRMAKGEHLYRAMKSINLSYTLAYKKRYAFVGHLWQGRFKSFIIDSDAYLLQCGAYIELNPSRAHLVKQPEQYTWSSYNVYARGDNDPLIHLNPMYLSLSKTSSQRQQHYRQFVRAQRHAFEKHRDRTPFWHPDLIDAVTAQCANENRPFGDASPKNRPRENRPRGDGSLEERP